jgi:hypothetical protein
VLELVLSDHADDEAVVEQRVAVVQRQLGKKLEHRLTNVAYELARRSRSEDRQRAALGTLVRERVVQVVVVRRHRLPTPDAPQQPELLEVAHVREIPDERRLQRRNLPSELLVVERL